MACDKDCCRWVRRVAGSGEEGCCQRVAMICGAATLIKLLGQRCLIMLLRCGSLIAAVLVGLAEW